MLINDFFKNNKVSDKIYFSSNCLSSAQPKINVFPNKPWLKNNKSFRRKSDPLAFIKNANFDNSYKTLFICIQAHIPELREKLFDREIILLKSFSKNDVKVHEEPKTTSCTKKSIKNKRSKKPKATMSFECLRCQPLDPLILEEIIESTLAEYKYDSIHEKLGSMPTEYISYDALNYIVRMCRQLQEARKSNFLAYAYRPCTELSTCVPSDFVPRNSNQSNESVRNSNNSDENSESDQSASTKIFGRIDSMTYTQNCTSTYLQFSSSTNYNPPNIGWVNSYISTPTSNKDIIFYPNSSVNLKAQTPSSAEQSFTKNEAGSKRLFYPNTRSSFATNKRSLNDFNVNSNSLEAQSYVSMNILPSASNELKQITRSDDAGSDSELLEDSECLSDPTVSKKTHVCSQSSTDFNQQSTDYDAESYSTVRKSKKSLRRSIKNVEHVPRFIGSNIKHKNLRSKYRSYYHPHTTSSDDLSETQDSSSDILKPNSRSDSSENHTIQRHNKYNKRIAFEKKKPQKKTPSKKDFFQAKTVSISWIQVGQSSSFMDNQQFIPIRSSVSSKICHLLKLMWSWEFPITIFNEVTQNNALIYLWQAAYFELGLITSLNIDLPSFLMYTLRIQEAYFPENPFHNQLHGADVLQTCFWFLTTGGLWNFASLSSLDCASFLFAAAIHDIGHPRRTNSFLARTNHHLALRYNDVSILENFHCASAFNVLKDPRYFFLKKSNIETYNLLRHRVIQCVLATDINSHYFLLAVLKIRQSSPDFLQGNQQEDKQILMNFCLHACDISNSAKETSLAVYWSEQIMKEYFDQGDEERELGFNISLYADRFTVNIAECQSQFLSTMVTPLFKLLKFSLPQVQICLDYLRINHTFWLSHYDYMEKQKLSGKHNLPKVLDNSKDSIVQIFLNSSCRYCFPMIRPKDITNSENSNNYFCYTCFHRQKSSPIVSNVESAIT